ncbi:BPSS1780 family membrane protein [Luteitalea sp.]|uniref:BPSS1780 family membrane protein n=1 Tax=Luteitalea sp. TaxID=2004800 RepID=UPI000AE5F5E0|nr:BPSS1780 family membrane protein [Luteitalea sp.]
MPVDNPFSPPSATLDAPGIRLPGAFIPDGRVVPAGHGWQWMREGLATFGAAPFTWLGITVLFLGLGAAISIIPLVSLLWNVAFPIGLGGLMMGCQAMAEQRPLEVRHLFAGMETPRLQPLAMLGVLYLAGSILLIVVLAIVGIGVAFGVIAVVGQEQIDAQPLLIGAGIVLLSLVVMAAVMVLSMTMWFSPALVALIGLPALDAMRMSLRASMRNMLPFLVYGLSILGVLLVAAAAGAGFMLAFGLAVPSLEIGWAGAGIGAVVVAGLVGMVFAPSMWGAMYASYRDVFVA